MPFNGSGIYSLPSGNPVVTGTTISSTTQNNTMSDVATALTDCVTKDGQSTPTANIPMGGFKFTGLGSATLRTDAITAGQVQDNAMAVLAGIGGTGDAITAGAVPPITAYALDAKFVYTPVSTNTLGAPTIAISGLTPKTIVQSNGLPLPAGALLVGTPYELLFDGTNFRVQSGQLGTGLHGQCRLVVNSTTALTLLPYNGNNLIINGITWQIPSVGVGLSIAGLSASTRYYIYAAIVSGSMALVASTTTHQTAINGVEIMSGDPTKTLVGMVYVNASVQFLDNTTNRTCLSWFNRVMKPIALIGTNSTTSTSIINISPVITFLLWADGGVSFGVSGTIANTVSGSNTQSSIFVDGSQAGANSFFSAFTANANGAISTRIAGQYAEGIHTMVLAGLVGSGNGTWTYSIDGLLMG